MVKRLGTIFIRISMKFTINTMKIIMMFMGNKMTKISTIFLN